MFMSYPGSYVRTSSAEAASTTSTGGNGAAKAAMLPWHQQGERYDAIPPSPYTILPPSLYPILPPPTPYTARVYPVPMTRSSSTTTTEKDSIVTDAQDYEDESDDVDGTPIDATTFDDYVLTDGGDGGFEYGSGGFEYGNVESEMDVDDSGSEFQLDLESEEETLPTVSTRRTLSVQQKKAALKAAEAVPKRAYAKRTTKASKKNTSGTSVNDSSSRTKGSASTSARKTRSSILLPQPSAESFIHRGVDMSPLTDKGYRKRKTWFDGDRDALTTAIHRWWNEVGAAQYTNESEIFLPSKKDNDCWKWIWTECKRVRPEFNQKEEGTFILARKMQRDRLL